MTKSVQQYNNYRSLTRLDICHYYPESISLKSPCYIKLFLDIRTMTITRTHTNDTADFDNATNPKQYQGIFHYIINCFSGWEYDVAKVYKLIGFTPLF